MLQQLPSGPEIIAGVFGFSVGTLFGYAVRALISFRRRQLFRRRHIL
jgi:hypothetical protein